MITVRYQAGIHVYKTNISGADYNCNSAALANRASARQKKKQIRSAQKTYYRVQLSSLMWSHANVCDKVESRKIPVCQWCHNGESNVATKWVSPHQFNVSVSYLIQTMSDTDTSRRKTWQIFLISQQW